MDGIICDKVPGIVVFHSMSEDNASTTSVLTSENVATNWNPRNMKFDKKEDDVFSRKPLYSLKSGKISRGKRAASQLVSTNTLYVGQVQIPQCETLNADHSLVECMGTDQTVATCDERDRSLENVTTYFDMTDKFMDWFNSWLV